MKSYGKQKFDFKLLAVVLWAVGIALGTTAQIQAGVGDFTPEELWSHDVTVYNNYDHLIAHTLAYYTVNAEAPSDILVGTMALPEQGDEQSPEKPNLSILRLDGRTGDLVWESKQFNSTAIRQVKMIDDENNDGAPDVVAVVNRSASQPEQANLVFLNGRSGEHLYSHPLEANRAPAARFEFDYLLTDKDIDGDQITDMVVTDASGYVTAFKGQGDPPPPPTCTDGTPYGECSVTKPFFCNEGILQEDCERCGCPDGKECNQQNGLCEAPPPPRYQLISVGNPDQCFEVDEVPIGTPRCGAIYDTLAECEAQTSCKNGSEYCEEQGPPWRPYGVWAEPNVECMEI